MPETSIVSGRPGPPRPPRWLTRTVTAGALFALLADLPGAAGSANEPVLSGAARLPATPGCPKVNRPATPRPEEPPPAPPNSPGPAPSPSALAQPFAGTDVIGLRVLPAERCRPPKLPPDVVVPEQIEPAEPPRKRGARAAKPGKAKRAHRADRPARPARQAAVDPPVGRYRRAAPARTPAAEPSLPVSGYGRLSARRADEAGGPDQSYRRSLLYSGLFGLLLAMIGLAMVTRLRQRW